MNARIGLCFILLALSLSGCSFGGFSDDNSGASASDSSPEKQILISGAISYGPVKTGNVTIHALNSDGTVGRLLGETSTDDKGNYAISVTYTGPILVEGSGIYNDLATGQDLPLAEPLRAVALAEADKPNIVMVTPLTELALQTMARWGIVSASTIGRANSLVSEMFKVNILTDKTALPEDLAKPETTQSQKDYYLATATMSEMASAKGGLNTVMTLLSNDIFDGEMKIESSLPLRDNLQKFLASERNTTGIPDIYRSNLLNMGGKVQRVRVATNRSLAGTAIKGIEVSIALPLEYTVRYDHPTGRVVDGAVTTSGSISPDGIKYTPPSASTPAVISFAMTFDESGLGDVAVLFCDLPTEAILDINSIILPPIEGSENPRFFDETGTTVLIPDLSLVFAAVIEE